MPEDAKHPSPLRLNWPHHWVETQAEVTDCTYARFSARLDGAGLDDDLAHYAVGFSYQVGGTSYKGVLSSPVEVQPHDTFAIRYNPTDPQENNSIESELDRPWFKEYTFLFAAAILGIMIYGFVQQHLLHH
jgi:hypothetical protein